MRLRPFIDKISDLNSNPNKLKDLNLSEDEIEKNQSTTKILPFNEVYLDKASDIEIENDFSFNTKNPYVHRYFLTFK